MIEPHIVSALIISAALFLFVLLSCETRFAARVWAVLLPASGVAVFFFVPWYRVVLLFWLALWILICAGSARTAMREVYDNPMLPNKSDRSISIITLVTSVLLTALSCYWLHINDLNFSRIDNVFGRWALMSLTLLLSFYVAQTRLLYDIIFPLISLETEEREAALERHFFINRGKAGRRYCVKFGGDLAIYQVGWAQYRSYVYQEGAVYSYAATKSVAGWKYIRKTPVLIRDVDAETYQKNYDRYPLHLRKSDYKRLPWSILLAVGILLLIASSFCIFAAISGLQNRSDLQSQAAKILAIAIASVFLSIKLIVISAKKIAAISRSDKGDPRN